MAKIYPRVYSALKSTGHSPATAQRIIIEAQRTDTKAIAMRWIKTVTRIARDWKQGRM